MFSNKNNTWRIYLFLIIFIVSVGVSCKKWDEHIATHQQNLKINLVQKMNQLPDLSVFVQCLKKVNLDRVINASNSYTIWAPDNKAMKLVPADVLQDTSKLKALLLNLISTGNHFINSTDDSVRIKMLNGKRVLLLNNKLDSAEVIKSNIFVRNGVIQIIDKAIAPLPNIWEFIQQTKDTYLQNNYISALNYTSQDPNLAEVDSIDPSTGEPVYKPGTGIVTINTFQKKVFDISNEDSLYTYFLLDNNTFQSQTDQEKVFFKSSSSEITDSNTYWNVSKDLVYKGLYLPDQFPETLISKFGVHVHINSNAIEGIQRVSNGIVYIINGMDYPLKEKVPVCVIQGEYPFEFSDSSDDFKSKIFYRKRKNDSTGLDFTDIYLNLGSSGSGDYVDYITNSLYTVKYKVYWVALNDYTPSPVSDGPYGTREPLPQILQISNYTDSIVNPPFDVESDIQPYNYSEVYLGDFENQSYDWLLQSPGFSVDSQTQKVTPATKILRLKSPVEVPSGVPHNITVDYIKLVPEIQ